MYLYVYTKEIGYGQFPFAKMNGFDVKNIGSQIIGGNPIINIRSIKIPAPCVGIFS
ncbi:hypothetical protein bthur0014_51340 [Bacillus thuringiensis IBL 4222]|nr:hypothetical protein bthur0014_51340 [Bacillus thuringiensis IBL 4222]MRB18781.1 hypothetical protein [Bacillus thuringiensis]MRB53924.1 hypothetical protein [Bacillus thuringiensis]MRC25998.1 hypothetical protein [Bacillus thuringiensis]TWG43372.1 hypothetical protein FHX98_2269 [Bacillus sp. AK8]